MDRRSTFGRRDWKAEAERYLDALATTIHERNEAYRELRECRAQLAAITGAPPPAAVPRSRYPDSKYQTACDAHDRETAAA